MPVTEPLVEPKRAPTPPAPVQPIREPEPFTKPDRQTPSQPSTPDPDRIVVPCTPCEGTMTENISLEQESFNSEPSRYCKSRQL